MAKTSAKAIEIYEWVKAHEAENITAADIANGTGYDVKVVNGTLTGAFTKKGLMERVPAEIELEDGSHKAIKLVKITEEGKSWVPVTSDE
jgi:hypothetical protein